MQVPVIAGIRGDVVKVSGEEREKCLVVVDQVNFDLRFLLKKIQYVFVHTFSQPVRRAKNIF